MRRGISPVVAVVLLIAISIVAAVALYFYAGGLSTRQRTTETPIAISASPIDPATGTIAIANLGSESLTLSSLNTADGTTCDFDGTVTIESGEQAICTMPPKRGTTILYGTDTGQAVVILSGTGVEDVTFQSSGYTTGNWTDPWSGTFSNTVNGSIFLDAKRWWENEVTGAASDQYYPEIAIDSNNVVHAVWSGNQDGDYDIYYANSSTDWTEVHVSNAAASQMVPTMAVDNNGVVHIAWQDARTGNWDIYYANSSTGWSEVVVDNDASGETAPSIAVDNNNVAHLSWGDQPASGDSDINYANSSTGWNVVKIYDGSSAGSPSIGADNNDVIHIAWTGNSYEIYYANSSTGWVSTDISSVAGTHTMTAFARALAIDNSDVIHVAWDYYNGGDYDIYYANSSSGWSNTLANDASRTQSYAVIAVDNNSVAHIAWKGETNVNIFYTNSSSWVETQITSSYGHDAPTIATDSNNVVHIAYQAPGDGTDVNYANSTEYYYTSGTFLSDVENTGYSPANFTSVTWTNSTPAGATFELKLYFSNYSNFSVNTSVTPTNGQTNLDAANQYIRYWTNLTTTDQSVTPTLTAFTVDYKPANYNFTYTVNLDDGIDWVALNRSDGSIVVNESANCDVFYSNTVENSTAYTYEVIAYDCAGVEHRDNYP